jgi:hypothetical protein
MLADGAAAVKKKRAKCGPPTYDLVGGDLCATCPRRDGAAGREGWYYMI